MPLISTLLAVQFHTGLGDADITLTSTRASAARLLADCGKHLNNVHAAVRQQSVYG